MYRGVMGEGGLYPEFFYRFDMVFSGHYHHKSSKDNVHYLGTPYEINWHDYKDPRGFHIFDTATRELTFIQNPHSLFCKLWYDDENVKDVNELLDFDPSVYKDAYVKIIITSRKNPFWFDMFIDKLYTSDASDIQIVDDHFNAHLTTDEEIMGEVKDTLTLLSNYVAEAEIDVDKKALDKVLKSLYNEALSLET